MCSIFKNDSVASIFAHVLRILGVDSVVISRRVVKKYLQHNKGNSIEILHTIANNILRKRIKICIERIYGVPIGFYKNITILYDTKKYMEVEYYIVDIHEKCSIDITNKTVSLFLSVYPKIPMILIDATLWELHHEEEKRKAIKQFLVLINTIRKRLTDLNILLVSPPIELIDLVKEAVEFIETNDNSIYNTIDSSKAIILDPYAHDELTVKDIMENHYFIVGLLIDDKFPRPYATYMLKLLQAINFNRKAIKLYGSIIGVPKEINKIIDIILDVKLNSMSLEEAIINNMSIDDKVKRIIYDIEKDIAKRRTIDENYIERYISIYKVNNNQFRKIYKRIKNYLKSLGRT